MPCKPIIATISAAVLVLSSGCERDREQPWRKALDEGRVIRLGGDVGKLTPRPETTNAPLFPQPVVVQPMPGSAPAVKKADVDDLPIPPAPKAIEKKTAAPATDDE